MAIRPSSLPTSSLNTAPVTTSREAPLQPFRTLWRWAFFLGFACLPAFAQQNVQFLPEVDAYLKLNPMLRVYVEAKDDQDGGDSAQAGIGPSVQLYLKPLATLKKMRAFDLDDVDRKSTRLNSSH